MRRIPSSISGAQGLQGAGRAPWWVGFREVGGYKEVSGNRLTSPQKGEPARANPLQAGLSALTDCYTQPAQLYMVGLLRKQELKQKGASWTEQRDNKEDARIGEEEVVDEKEDKPEKGGFKGTWEKTHRQLNWTSWKKSSCSRAIKLTVS